MPIIEVNNASKQFKKPIRKQGIIGMIKTLFSFKYTITQAVDNISFSVEPGEIIGYIGENGAGKSTTIKMMCGVLTPSSGEIRVKGLRPYNSKERMKILGRIGVVFGQKTQLWWDLPLIESLNIFQHIYNIPKIEYEERLKYLTALLDLASFIKQPVRTLSLGQRMRADLAASLIHNPEILFLDEPTIGLDILVKEKIIQAIKEINIKYNTTIILTTHNMEDITDLCKRIIILDKGKIIYDDSLKNINKHFGDIRHICLTARNHLDLEVFNQEFNNKLTFTKKEGYLDIAFDVLQIELNNVLNYILQNCQVVDLKINENSLESIVMKIYDTKKD